MLLSSTGPLLGDDCLHWCEGAPDPRTGPCARLPKSGQQPAFRAKRDGPPHSERLENGSGQLHRHEGLQELPLGDEAYPFPATATPRDSQGKPDHRRTSKRCPGLRPRQLHRRSRRPPKRDPLCSGARPRGEEAHDPAETLRLLRAGVPGLHSPSAVSMGGSGPSR